MRRCSYVKISRNISGQYGDTAKQADTSVGDRHAWHSHFMRWFKKMTGQGFTAYLNDHRLNLAAELLRITDATVLDIAGRVGFDNLSYFNRLFKRRYGMTPREYRSK